MAEIKIGDRVTYSKVPTEKDWIGVGQVPIPFAIGTVLTVQEVCNGRSLIFREHDPYFPIGSFTLGKVLPSTDFKVGEEVIYFREPTSKEWDGVGEVTVPFPIGTQLIIETVTPSTLRFKGRSYVYPKQVFRKTRMPAAGDYVVTVRVTGGVEGRCAKDNYCFKIRDNQSYMTPCTDLIGSKVNSNFEVKFDLSAALKEWRFATEAEIKRYNELDKPFDVTELAPAPTKFPVEGDYVVILEVEISASARNNYCFKIRETHPYIRPCVDLNGSRNNGNPMAKFDLSSQLKAWRFATPSEIAQYDKLGKPFDVTTLEHGLKSPEKDDYIVILEIDGASSIRTNNCYKVRETHPFLRPCLDHGGSYSNGFPEIMFDLSGYLKKWRYATAEEAREYDRIKQPFDVTMMKESIKFPIKGDYVVTLEVSGSSHNCARDNYCFKIRETSKGVRPCVDISGCHENTHDYMSWDLKGGLKKWRFATAEEIEKYDELGIPYDVTADLGKKLRLPQKGDFIVTVKVTGGKEGCCAKDNYCFEVRETHHYLRPAVDLEGDRNNGNCDVTFDGKRSLQEWRYASSPEIETYKIIGKPYDVTIPVASKVYAKTPASEIPAPPIEAKPHSRSYKFKEGDMVRVIEAGRGVAGKDIGTVVAITELGDYSGDPGYKVTPAIGNTASGKYNGFIGECSFELVKTGTIKVVEFNPSDFCDSWDIMAPTCKKESPVTPIFINVPKI